MDTVPLNDGDLRWVFQTLVDESEVRAALRQAADHIEQLAGHLGVLPAWTGAGLELHPYPDGRMLAAATWVHQRGTEVPPGSWRQLDPRVDHA